MAGKPGARLTGLHARGLERPHVWCTGPDPIRHEMYHPWQMAKAQAKFRGEEFTLTFDEYYDLWIKDWHLRGRKSDDMCMTRFDESQGWTKKNTIIINRKQHFQERSGKQRHKNGQFKK